MVQISVEQLESGDTLLEDVVTALGSTLFYKGSVISDREKEILQAFSVNRVEVRRAKTLFSDPDVQEEEASTLVQPVSEAAVNQHFQNHYQELLQIMRKVFKNTSEAENLPIVELRSHLDAMVPLFDQQDLLTYSPTAMRAEDYLYHKSIMVALTSYLIASWANFEQKDLMPVTLAGLLHDIGNMGVDPAILNKPDQLTPAEMEEVKKHTIIGYNRLKNVLGIKEGVKLAALQHHEREDGSGYPLGMKGDKIHAYAKVVAIADIFYAMTRARKYRHARSPYIVLDQLVEDSFGKLDPAIVRTFVYRITQHQLGYTVRLSDGSVGKIVYADRSNPTRPWIDVKGKIVNLAQNRHLHIADVLSKSVD